MSYVVKHTPGPWHVTRGSEYVRHVQSDGTAPNVCEMVNWPADEAKANARAIAALPDMVESLCVLRDAVRRDHLADGVHDDCPTCRALHRAWAALDAAGVEIRDAAPHNPHNPMTKGGEL